MSRLRRVVLGLGALALLGAVGLLTAGWRARRELSARFPPPGRLVDIGGRRLHLSCRGEGPVTVVLLAGLNEFSVHWQRVQPALAARARTCAYDRAGLGWSDPSASPPTLAEAVADLERLLRAAELEGPLLLVGHSYGGLLARAFRAGHPDRVVGMVLVDPASEHLDERVDGYAALLQSVASQFRTLATLSRVGLIALARDRIPAGYLDGTAADEYRAALAAGTFFEAAAAETASFTSLLAAFRAAREPPLGELPLVVVSRGRAEGLPGFSAEQGAAFDRTWAELQAQIAALSPAGRRTIAEGSGHEVHLERPDAVIEAVTSLLDSGARARGRRGAPEE